jgi:immune inhibitor A
LAFQWQDFYDPNYNDDGKHWDGSGSWDLMASGSHNHGGSRPAHPAALHKLQHGWVTVQTVKKTASITLPPSTQTSAKVCRVVSSAYAPGQYLLLENRRRQGFDSHLPGEGLLVWKIDERKEMFAPATPGMQLIQADGLQNLGDSSDYNEGDAGDPFPGSEGRNEVSEADTSFPGKKSGVRLSNIRIDAKGSVTLKVTFSVAAMKVAPVVATKASEPELVKQIADRRLTLSGLLKQTSAGELPPIPKLPLERGSRRRRRLPAP